MDRLFAKVGEQWRRLRDRKHSPLEEEMVAECAADRWYPVSVGKVFQSKFEVLGKIGWGRTSTIWFVYDSSDDTYKVLKVCIHDCDRTGNEEAAYDRMRGMETEHIGASCVRHILDEFEVQGPSGYWHHCFVFEPAACTVSRLMRVTGPLRIPTVKNIMRNVLSAIDWLHTEVNLVHTDIKASNILYEHKSPEALEAFAKALKKHSQRPTGPRKTYRSIQMPLSKQILGGPMLGDLGEARHLPLNCAFDPAPIVGPKAFRAPETLLGLDWGHEVDIWMAGCMFVDLLTDDNLFDSPPQEPEEWSESWHLAQIVALLGPPPVEMVRESELAKKYFEADGVWKGCDGWTVPHITVEEKLAAVDTEVKGPAVDFLRAMLTWDLDERKTAKALLEHPFLQ